LNGHNSKNFMIEERRRQVASLLARSMTQTEIALQLGVDQSTISDDVKALRLMSQRFIYDLAKSDLAYYYKQCLTGIEEAKKEAWTMYDRWNAISNLDNAKYRLMALKVAIQAEEAKFKLLTEGPNILTVKRMEDRLHHIEQNIQEANR
jgi:transposase